MAVKRNNPGNIRDTKWSRSQPGYVGGENGFAVFDNPDSGTQAIASLLGSYKRRGFDTLDAIVNRWAPPSDNNPNNANYVSYVAKQAGIGPGDQVSDEDIPKIAAAMSGFETGVRHEPAAAAPTQVAEVKNFDAYGRPVASEAKSPAPAAVPSPASTTAPGGASGAPADDDALFKQLFSTPDAKSAEPASAPDDDQLFQQLFGPSGGQAIASAAPAAPAVPLGGTQEPTGIGPDLAIPPSLAAKLGTQPTTPEPSVGAAPTVGGDNALMAPEATAAGGEWRTAALLPMRHNTQTGENQLAVPGFIQAPIDAANRLLGNPQEFDPRYGAPTDAALKDIASVSSVALGGGSIPERAMAAPAASGRASLADLAINKFGIPLRAGQIASNEMVNRADMLVGKLPFSGGTVSKEAQLGAFTRAVSKEMGEDADALTPDVMAQAKARIGREFDDVADKVPSIPVDQRLAEDVKGILNDAHGSLEASKLAPVISQIENISQTFSLGEGAITGKQYQSLTAKNSMLSKAIDAGGDIGRVAQQLKDALDGALERAASPEVRKQLTQARYQYKVMKTVEDLAEKAPTGEISPTLLMGAVRGRFPNMAYDGAGNMGDLARIGQMFLKAPSSSGTAENNALLRLAGIGGGGGLLAMNPGAIPQVAAVAGGAAVASKLAGAAMRSKWLANALLSQASKGRIPSKTLNTINALIDASPRLAPQSEGRNQLLLPAPASATPASAGRLSI